MSALTKKQFQSITTLFPLSPIDAQSSLPETLGRGKILTYTARIDMPAINAIVTQFTEEDPTAKKSSRTDSFSRWKHQIQYDEDGNKIEEIQTESGGTSTRKVYAKRWEPQSFAHNRKPGQPHIKALAGRFSRIGFKPSLRKIVIGSNFHCLDGQHGLLALWHALNNGDIEYADVSIEINNLDNPVELFRLFDQAQRKRTLKDVLTSIDGIPEGFEASLAGALRFVTLLAGGKELNSSRMNLSHIVDPKGKMIPILPDELASLMESGECFDYILELVPKLLSKTTLITLDDDSEENITTLAHPMVSGPSRPNMQYYLTAFFNWFLDPDTELEQDDAVNKFCEFLEEIAQGGDSDCLPARKVSDYSPKKAIDWLPRIESCFKAFLQDKKEFKPSRVISFKGIQNHYTEWFDDNYSDTNEAE